MPDKRKDQSPPPVDERATKRVADMPQIILKKEFKKDEEFEWFENGQVVAYSTINGDNGGVYDPFYDPDAVYFSDPDDERLEEYEATLAFQTKAKGNIVHLGDVFGRLMRRNEIYSDFWERMEEPSQDTAAMGFDLFNRYGKLKQDFIHGAHKGTGIWGEEVNLGNILQIEIIRVEKPHRRQGIATKMLSKLLADAAAKDDHLKFAFAWPVMLNSELPRNLPEDERSIAWEEKTKEVVGLFQKVGFRRVGDSAWFCYAFDPKHPSRHLAIEDDHVPSEPKERTELEKLEARLEKLRTTREHMAMTIVVSDSFRGFSDGDVKTLLQLRSIQDPSPSVTIAAKYGCSCGKCLGGYISPRVRYQVLTQAEILKDMLPSDYEMSRAARNFEFSMVMMVAKHLPEFTQQRIQTNISVAQGFFSAGAQVREKRPRANLFQMFGRIAECLRRNEVPNVRNVVQKTLEDPEWPPHTKNYMDVGGRVEPVIEGLFDWVIEQSEEAGDGMFFDVPAFQTEHDALPSCRNDGEWGFVRGMLLQTGP